MFLASLKRLAAGTGCGGCDHACLGELCCPPVYMAPAGGCLSVLAARIVPRLERPCVSCWQDNRRVNVAHVLLSTSTGINCAASERHRHCAKPRPAACEANHSAVLACGASLSIQSAPSSYRRPPDLSWEGVHGGHLSRHVARGGCASRAAEPPPWGAALLPRRNATSSKVTIGPSHRRLCGCAASRG